MTIQSYNGDQYSAHLRLFYPWNLIAHTVSSIIPNGKTQRRVCILQEIVGYSITLPWSPAMVWEKNCKLLSIWYQGSEMDIFRTWGSMFPPGHCRDGFNKITV